MENPIKLVIKNHELFGEHLTETEIRYLIKMLGLLNYYSDLILELHFDRPPCEHAQGYAMSRKELNKLFCQSEKLKQRLQRIIAPGLATEIQKYLEVRYKHLEKEELRLVLQDLIEECEDKYEDECDFEECE